MIGRFGDPHPSRKKLEFLYCYAFAPSFAQSQMVSSLITSSGLTSSLTLTPPRPATEDELTSFHSRDYVEFVQQLSQSKDQEKLEEEGEQYGLGILKDRSY